MGKGEKKYTAKTQRRKEPEILALQENVPLSYFKRRGAGDEFFVDRNVVKFLFVTICVAILLSGCHQDSPLQKAADNSFEIRDFIPLSNWHIDSAGNINNHTFISKSINLDYTDAFSKGFIIPTGNQVAEGQFRFEFL